MVRRAEIGGIARHARALGLIAAGAIYIALTPYLGYPVSTAALICGVALYAGMAPSLRLAAVGAAGGAVFWVMFVKLLGVAMPVGLFARLHG